MKIVFLSPKFKILENIFGITDKRTTLIISQDNYTIERVHRVLINVVRIFDVQDNYVGKDNPWKGILTTK